MTSQDRSGQPSGAEARELDPKADHQLKVEFGDGQFWVTLLCPESGCTPAWDAPDGGDECWLKGWAEASAIDEGLVGEVIVAVSTSWDGDGPVSKIVADAQLAEWRERAQKAEAEVNRYRTRPLAAERDAALARAEKLIADVDDLINERDVLSSRLREAEIARDNLRPFVVQAHRDRSRLREAEGIIEQLLARAVPSSRRQTDAAKHARRFLSYRGGGVTVELCDCCGSGAAVVTCEDDEATVCELCAKALCRIERAGALIPAEDVFGPLDPPEEP